LHVNEIAKRNGTDVGKCGMSPPFLFLTLLLNFFFLGGVVHILRLLSTHHILREVKPDVFANNRISALMDSGKEVRELIGFGK
jgi:hypothetical protein